MEMKIKMERMKKYFKEFHVFKDPTCIFVILSSAGTEVTYCGWHAFIIPHALQRGLSVENTLLITFCASVGNLLGRLVTGFLTDHLVKPINVYLLLAFSDVGFLLFYAFLQQISVMLLLSFLSAWTIVGRTLLPVMMIRERVPPKEFPVAFAILDVLMGFGVLLGGCLSGKNVTIYRLRGYTFPWLSGFCS